MFPNRIVVKVKSIIPLPLDHLFLPKNAATTRGE
ncbi:unnamed protein product [Brassica oleracea]